LVFNESPAGWYAGNWNPGNDAAAPQVRTARSRDEMVAERGLETAIVASHDSRLSDNVCSDDRRQFALLTGHPQLACSP